MVETWTIQSKEVIEIINAHGEYLPSLNHFDFKLAGFDHMKLCYYAAVSIFNLVNKQRREGVVFAMAPAPDEPFASMEEVSAFFQSDPEKLAFLAKNGKSLIDDNHVLLKLRYDEEFNPLPIDIHTFVAFSDYLYDHRDENKEPCLTLMPSLHGDAYFPKIQRQFTCWMNGEYGGPFTEQSATPFREFNGTIIQLHLPYIRSENIVSIHPAIETFPNFNLI